MRRVKCLPRAFITHKLLYVIWKEFISSFCIENIVLIQHVLLEERSLMYLWKIQNTFVPYKEYAPTVLYRNSYA